MEQKEFEERYLKHLNVQQRQAVTTLDGNVLLLATPGSGKTTVLVTRLGYMICCRNIDPSKILTMTYTRAATHDMTHRFESLFGKDISRTVTFRTINALSAGIISHLSAKRGEESFVLLDDDAEINRLIRQIYKRFSEEYPEDGTVKDIRTKISYIKNMMLSDDEIANSEWDIEHMGDIYRNYQSELRKTKRMDFDDQMVYALAILRKRPDVLEYYQDMYPYICVDEAQDTSKIQHTIIKLLAAKYQNLFMVGDEDQSIYGFRAAYPEALLQFEQDHPGATVLLMEENYRSSASIVDVANQFIARNRFRHKKSIIPTRDIGAPIHIAYCSNRETQYDALHEMAKNCERETAILYRNNDSALPLIDTFERDGISYFCRNYDDHFFTHRMICDIREIISYAYEPDNYDLFLRVYHKFCLPISKTNAEAAVELCKKSKLPVFEALLKVTNARGFIRDGIIDLIRSFPLIPKDDALAAINRVWNDMNYRRYVEQKKWDAGKFFILSLLAKNVPSPRALFEKLDNLQKTIKNPVNYETNKVILSTIHSSKGLEYDRVFLFDIIDGILPFKKKDAVQSLEEEKAYEEERRLFYVGMTRAKNDLYLLRCPKESSFMTEVMRYLPTQGDDENDFIGSILRPQIGKQFMDREYGVGEIISQCESRFLVKFQSGELRLFRIEEMLSRYKPAETPKRSNDPCVWGSSAVLSKSVRDLMKSEFSRRVHAGSTIRHRFFGVGVVKTLDKGILTATFDQVGERRILLEAALDNDLLMLIS